VLRERPSGQLGAEDAKEFRDTGKYGGKEHTQKGAECAERRSQIHVLVVSAENGGKQLGQPRLPALLQGSFRNKLAQAGVPTSAFARARGLTLGRLRARAALCGTGAAPPAWG
jgi:hypothetical protein